MNRYNNYCVPEFEAEEDYSIPASSGLTMHRKSTMAGDEEIMELLWQNGPVVVQSQTQRPNVAANNTTTTTTTTTTTNNKFEDVTPTNMFMQEDEMSSWLQYPLDDHSFDRYLYTDLLYPPPPPSSTAAALPPPSITIPPRPPPPLVPQTRPNGEALKYQNFPQLQPNSRQKEKIDVPSSSNRPVMESTVVDSNETPAALRRQVSGFSRVVDSTVMVSGGNTSGGAAAENVVEREVDKCDLKLMSSSPGTNSANAEPPRQTLPVTAAEKRKGRDCEEAAGCRGEDVELEYANTQKQACGKKSNKRSRAAEVHNLSERRRRDRINEKMKALQELIPRCNKSDKASMLDEAIEYLKSLQLQVQMMSMGCSMVPMVFPGMQQYMSPMAMGMGMGMGMGMDAGMNMNRPMVPYPAILQGPSSSNSAAAHMDSRFPVPAFHMQPPVPVTGSSRIPAVKCTEMMPVPFVSQNASQPQITNLADPYQHYLSLQQAQLPLPQNPTTVQPNTKPSDGKNVGTPEHRQSGRSP